MITYRRSEFGVERIERGQSTFIGADSAHPAWREFQTWCERGNQPLAALPRPVFPAPVTKKSLWIIGAGGFGRELFGMTHTARGNEEWHVAGFLNDLPDSLDGFPGLPPIVCGTDYEPRENDLFICAIGNVAGRKKVCTKFEQRGAQFINIVQHTANVSASAQLGKGIVIEAMSGIGTNCRVGDFTMILTHACLSHDVTIGAGAHVAPFASILGRAQIGSEALIGSHAVILPDVKIGARATIGAGSVVIKDVPEGATVFGVPAQRIQ